MEKVQSVGCNNVGFKAGEQTQTQPVQNTATQPKDGDKKSMSALKWAGIIAAGALLAGGTIYAVKKAKAPKFENLTFENGIAKNSKKNGEVFSGIVDSPNGGKLEFQEGIIRQWEKDDVLYKYNENGKLESKIADDIETKFEFNEQGKIAKKIIGDEEILFNYNKKGQVIATLPDGTQEIFEKGKIVQKKLPDGTILDKDGNVVKKTKPPKNNPKVTLDNVIGDYLVKKGPFKKIRNWHRGHKLSKLKTKITQNESKIEQAKQKAEIKASRTPEKQAQIVDKLDKKTSQLKAKGVKLKTKLSALVDKFTK